MSTLTAWKFAGTEGADDAVLRVKQLGAQQVIDVEDAAVIRWPLHATQPSAQEHVTAEGGKMSSLMQKVQKAGIESAMIDSVKTDMAPGTSALVLQSSGARIDRVAQAFSEQNMELIRSNLSVEQEDQLRAAFGHSPGPKGS
jgi:uncharacterized membrane protein